MHHMHPPFPSMLLSPETMTVRPSNSNHLRFHIGAYSAPSATFNVLGTGGSSTAASTQGFAAFQGEGRKLRS